MKNIKYFKDILNYYRDGKITLLMALQCIQNTIGEEVEELAGEQGIKLTKDVYEVNPEEK